MTREAFIKKWLGNPEKPYTPENRDEMRDDLDNFIAPTPSHYTFADKEVIDMMASIWGNEAARMFLTLSAFKYQMRAGRKTDDPTADLEKARHCLELATEYDEKEMPLFHKHNYTQKNTPDNAPDDNFDEGWNDSKYPPRRDEFVFVRYISKDGFQCVKTGRYDPELDVFLDLDGYRINNPTQWKPMK